MPVQDAEIKALLLQYKQICVYGLSPKPEKPSHYVPQYMRSHGWQLIGTYPKVHTENGFEIYQTLSEIPKGQRKFINAFRASDKIPALVDEIISLGDVEVLWLQLGIQHTEAEARAEKAGIRVVSNRCLKIEHEKWF